MKELRKKLVIMSLLAAFTLPSSTAFAEVFKDITSKPVQTEVSETSDTTPAVHAMSLDDAIAYATENSYSLVSLKAAESKAQAQKSESRQTLRNYRNRKSTNAMIEQATQVTSGDMALLSSGYLYRASCFGYRSAQRATLEGEYKLKSEVSVSYYTYLNNKKKLEIAEESLNTAKERLKYAEIKYKNGQIAQTDLNSFQLSVLESQNSVNQSKRTLDLSMRSFKSYINYPQNGELILTGSFQRQNMDSTSPENAIEKSMSGIARTNLEENLELAKFKRDRLVSFHTANSVSGRAAKAEYAEAELSYKNSINSLENSIYTVWNSMMTAYEQLNYLDSSLEITEKQIQAAKTRYDLGLITATDYLSTVQQLDSLKVSIADTELAAYQACEQYRVLYDCTNTIFQEDDPLL